MERQLWHRIFDRYIKMFTPEWYLPTGAKYHTGTQIKWNEESNVDIKYSGDLRPYQIEWLMHISDYDGWLIEAGTWSWKSHIIMSIAELYKKKTLIICPTKKLVKEMVEKFKEFTNYEPWTYYSDGKKIKDITVTTHMSFVKDTLGKKELGLYDVIIIDECDDRLSEKMIHSICYSNCNILVWLSGTPDRQELNLDDMQLIFWPHIKIGEYQVLPDEITHYMYKRSADEAATIDYTNRHEQRESIMWNNIRYKVVSDKIEEISKWSFLTLLLLDRISEIEKYQERFPEALVITGKTKVKDDEVWIDAIRKKWWIIIWSIKKMYRWVDIPEVDNVIIASPIRFENNVIQSIWRALRPSPNKTKVSINIINDNVLQSQKRAQTKTCKDEYNIVPNVVYIFKEEED